jgi:hypothetical protein
MCQWHLLRQVVEYLIYHIAFPVYLRFWQNREDWPMVYRRAACSICRGTPLLIELSTFQLARVIATYQRFFVYPVSFFFNSTIVERGLRYTEGQIARFRRPRESWDPGFKSQRVDRGSFKISQSLAWQLAANFSWCIMPARQDDCSL